MIFLVLPFLKSVRYTRTTYPDNTPHKTYLLLIKMHYLSEPESFLKVSDRNREEIEREFLTRLQRVAAASIEENSDIFEQENSSRERKTAEMIVNLILDMETEFRKPMQ